MTIRRRFEEEDDDPRDLEEREDYRAAHARNAAGAPPRHNNQKGQGASGNDRSVIQKEERTSQENHKESFLQRIGLTPLLGAAAAVITAVAALVNAFNSRSGHAPDTPPAAAASTFNVSDYWYGTPANTSQPLIFHILIAESASTAGTPARSGTVMGTMRNPCQGEAVIRIDSGTWDGSRLQLRVTHTGSGKPLALDVHRTGDELEGSVLQGTYDGQITLHRGETGCSAR